MRVDALTEVHALAVEDAAEASTAASGSQAQVQHWIR